RASAGSPNASMGRWPSIRRWPKSVLDLFGSPEPFDGSSKSWWARSNRPILRRQAGDPAEITEIASDQSSPMFLDDRSDFHVHPPDVEPQSEQDFVSRDGCVSERQDRQAGQEPDVIDQSLVGAGQFLRLFCLSEQRVPAGE